MIDASMSGCRSVGNRSCSLTVVTIAPSFNICTEMYWTKRNVYRKTHVVCQNIEFTILIFCDKIAVLPSWWGPPLLALGWLASLTSTWSCWAALQKRNRSGSWWSAGRPRVWSMTGPASERSGATIYPAEHKWEKWQNSRKANLTLIKSWLYLLLCMKIQKTSPSPTLPTHSAVLYRIKMTRSSNKPPLRFLFLLFLLIFLLLSNINVSYWDFQHCYVMIAYILP